MFLTILFNLVIYVVKLWTSETVPTRDEKKKLHFIFRSVLELVWFEGIKLCPGFFCYHYFGAMFLVEEMKQFVVHDWLEIFIKEIRENFLVVVEEEGDVGEEGIPYFTLFGGGGGGGVELAISWSMKRHW